MTGGATNGDANPAPERAPEAVVPPAPNSAAGMGAALRRALMMEELGGLLRDMEIAGVACAVLKGPPLQARLYPPELRRDSSDIDLLIRPADLDRAEEVLLRRGYPAPEPAARRRALASHYHVYYERPKPPPIELHFRLFGGFAASIPSEPFLDRSVVFKMEGLASIAGASGSAEADAGVGASAGASSPTMRVLTPADELFYLLLHAAIHMRDPRWIRDIKRWLEITPSPDWKAVMRPARECGTVNAVAWSLDAALAREGKHDENTTATPPWPAEAPRVRGWRRNAALRLEAAAPAAPSARRLILYHYLYEAALSDHSWRGAIFLAAKLAEPILRRLGL